MIRVPARLAGRPVGAAKHPILRIADQGISSGTNASFALVLAQVSSTEDFVKISILYSLLMGLVGLDRAVIGDAIQLGEFDDTSGWVMSFHPYSRRFGSEGELIAGGRSAVGYRGPAILTILYSYQSRGLL